MRFMRVCFFDFPSIAAPAEVKQENVASYDCACIMELSHRHVES